MPENLQLGPILVIALHEQRPDQDAEVVATIIGQIEDYGGRIASVSPDVAETMDPAWPELELFRPQTALLWGSYDHATFYLADDLESISPMSFSSGAVAQEFLFGAPYLLGEDQQSSLEGLATLFDPERAKKKPLLLISRIKLGDHLLAATGASLPAAVAHAIDQKKPGVAKVILRCWAWPEVVVLFFGDSPFELLDAAAVAESLTIDELRKYDPAFGDALDRAVEHPVPRRLLRLWVEGRHREHQRSWPKIAKGLGNCNAVISAKAQLGIHQQGWGKSASLCLPQRLGNACSVAFEPQRIAKQPFGKKDAEGILDDLEEAFARLDEPSTASSSAHITILPKPGHSPVVRWFAEQLAAVTGGRAEVWMTHDGQGNSIKLSLALEPSLRGLVVLFALSHSFRICRIVSLHLLNIQTRIDWGCSSRQDPMERVPFWPEPQGYRLLGHTPSPELLTYERHQTALQGLGRVQGLAIRAWQGAVMQISTKPEMYGATLELYSATLALRRSLLFSPEDASPLHAQAAPWVMRYGKRAYHQRVQFAPSLSGVPPINSELPFGVNQIVRMVDGLVATITHAVYLADGEARADPDRLARKLVVFEANAAIAIGTTLDFNVLKLSLLQAMTPLSLCLLFHELGHLIVHRWCHLTGPPKKSYFGTAVAKQKWQEARRQMGQRIAPPPPPSAVNPSGDDASDGDASAGDQQKDTAERIELFLEDIFAHAVWRRVGCADDFELFRTQFLAGQAMGLRTESDLKSGWTPIEVWAETATHLLVQKALSACGDHPDDALDRLRQEIGEAICSPRSLDPMIDQILPFAHAELRYGFAKQGKLMGRAQIQEQLRNQVLWIWLPRLLRLCKAGPRRLYRQHLRELFTMLADIARELEQAETLLADDDNYQGISGRLTQGKPVLAPAWDLLSDEGCPTGQALLWARAILKAVTECFVEARPKDCEGMSVFRTPELKFDRVRNAEPLCGVFTDFYGGLFAAGGERRQDYLGVRLAAIESLAELANRVMAGSIWLRFQRGRTFWRQPIDDQTTQIQLSDGSKVAATVVDICPIGVGLAFPGAALPVKKDDRFLIESIDQRWLECRVVWVDIGSTELEAGNPPRAGAELIAGSKRTLDHEEMAVDVAVRPQVKMRWVR